MNRTTIIAVSSQQSAVSKSRGSEFPPTDVDNYFDIMDGRGYKNSSQQSAVSKSRESEFPPTQSGQSSLTVSECGCAFRV